MLVPFLAVVLRVMVDSSGKTPVRKSAPDAADAIMKSMFSQVGARALQAANRARSAGFCFKATCSPMCALPGLSATSKQCAEWPGADRMAGVLRSAIADLRLTSTLFLPSFHNDVMMYVQFAQAGMSRRTGASSRCPLAEGAQGCCYLYCP